MPTRKPEIIQMTKIKKILRLNEHIMTIYNSPVFSLKLSLILNKSCYRLNIDSSNDTKFLPIFWFRSWTPILWNRSFFTWFRSSSFRWFPFRSPLWRSWSVSFGSKRCNLCHKYKEHKVKLFNFDWVNIKKGKWYCKLKYLPFLRSASGAGSTSFCRWSRSKILWFKIIIFY